MSTQHQETPTVAAAGSLSCSFCSCELEERMLALQLYPGSECDLPDSVGPHGGITLCPTCAAEATELLDAWDEHDQPPVSRERIGDGYAAVANGCSFCDGSCRETVLGVELYRRVGDRLPAYANYTLCERCQAVFGEFLQNLRRVHR